MLPRGIQYFQESADVLTCFIWTFMCESRVEVLKLERRVGRITHVAARHSVFSGICWCLIVFHLNFHVWMPGRKS